MKANTAATDAQLIRRSRQGDGSAYGKLVERYQSLACSIAYNRCGDLATSEDLAQEAFMQAWHKLADLKDVTKFKSWLCTIVRNLATRSREQSARSVSNKATPIESIAEPSSAAIDPADRVVSAEEEQLVWKALAAVPENYREPMILFYREEQSVAKVAEALEISPDAVKQRLSRGRKFLQEQLAATVQSTLEKSKPTQNFTSAVLLGLAGAKTKTAAGVLTGAAAKSTASATGLGGLFLIPIAKLPILAWILKTAWDETRSPREKQLMVRQLIFLALGLIPMIALMIASSGWKNNIQSPILRAMILPGIMVLYYIPMIISCRRLGKRIEQLRIEEKTDTPLRNITNQDNGSTRWLFIGSGLLVASWPSLLAMISGDWITFAILLSAAAVISLLGSLVPPVTPTWSFRAYVFSLGAIALVGIGVMLGQRIIWFEGPPNPVIATRKPAEAAGPSFKRISNTSDALNLKEQKRPHNTTEIAGTKLKPLSSSSPGQIRLDHRSVTRSSFWWVATLQAMTMTYTILAMLAWKRVYGKRQD